MNIIELVKHLKSVEAAETFFNTEFPEIEYDLIDIYMIDRLSLGSEIVFFDAEKMSNELIINIAGITYENLFPANLAQNIVEEFVAESKKPSNVEIAQRLLDYRKKDA
jgi:hypothetical protein